MPRESEFPPMPPGIARLPRSKANFPIPWFVHVDENGPDFRVIRHGAILEAVLNDLCWVCGDKLDAEMAFAIGPMCAINRISAEPPSHPDCAVWSAMACPFLANPTMVRRDIGNLAMTTHVSGEMIQRNPGVTLVWGVYKDDWAMISDGRGGQLFYVGTPSATAWFAQGRKATRQEVVTSIESGFPELRRLAQEGGEEELKHLDTKKELAMLLAPA